jgi:hypothetical protein
MTHRYRLPNGGEPELDLLPPYHARFSMLRNRCPRRSLDGRSWVPFGPAPSPSTPLWMNAVEGMEGIESLKPLRTLSAPGLISDFSACRCFSGSKGRCKPLRLGGRATVP